jgi:MFS transporter, DHA1 family, tetracycline resistance protein
MGFQFGRVAIFQYNFLRSSNLMPSGMIPARRMHEDIFQELEHRHETGQHPIQNQKQLIFMNDTTSVAQKKFPLGTLLFLLASMFLGTMGFGITTPVLPFLIEKYISNPNQAAPTISWLISACAICSFFAAPILGALSDRFGRKPILVLCLLGSAVGYVAFGIGGALWVLFLGRILDGLTAGDFGTISSMIAENSPKEDIGKHFGQMGGAAGAGFLIGPVFGGFLAKISLETPFFVAGALTLIVMLWGLFFVPESLKPENRGGKVELSTLNPLLKIAEIFAMPKIRLLVIASAIFMISFVMLQSNFGLLVKDSLGWGPGQIALIFSIVGVCDILVQSFLLGFLIKTLGEQKLLLLSLLMVVAGLSGFALLPVVKLVWIVVAATVAFAIGEGMFTSTLGGLVAKHTEDNVQGQVQGGTQSLGSLMQALSPSLGGQLYSKVSAGAPFWAGAAIVLAGAGLLLVGEKTAAKATPLQEA